VVTISASSSVIELGADNAEANKGVYNLLGVKVLDNASEADLSRLPAGVYIVNGQKRVVR
ncbi:MAG: hypothetical protein K2L78_00245, partial [Muribaculaceae bacterium]|nr:hypothetical protein [Muribaculaceae bacterium]